MSLLDAAIHFEGDLYRNVVSIRVSQQLADDLGDDPADWEVFTRAEMATKPRRPVPAINRPFEDGYGQAILYPFVKAHWFETRFSDGGFPAWYGSLDLETTVHETAHHFRRRAIEDLGLQTHQRPILGERRVYLVAADGLLIDLRRKTRTAPGLIDRDSYAFCQQVGREIQTKGHPGLLTRSARCKGDNAVLFEQRYLSDPRDHCFLTYRYLPTTGQIEVERKSGVVWMRIQ